MTTDRAEPGAEVTEQSQLAYALPADANATFTIL
jgi:hypothetical protein